MNNLPRVVLCLLFFLTCFAASSQKGIIRGQVIEAETGEPLFSANAVLSGTTVGATTDFDGNFEIKADPGTYDLKVSFIGLSSVTITGVEVKSDEVTVIDVIQLKPASNELEAVTITVEAAKNTEEALMTVKRKSANVLDGISAAKLRKTGDSDAGDAVKRVTGVSVEGGKYVYVRGLGDRYTKTMLNGVDVPGLDPDKNSIQIDIFPTNLISNMTVLKSALAELPADFTGGVVDIQTKEFPVEKILEISVGIGYNPSMHFNSNYLNYEGSSTDFLGFDGGEREIPERSGIAPAANFRPDAEVNEFVKKFNKTLGADVQTSPMDFSLGFSSGNQYNLSNGNKLGYIFSATYKNSTTFYEEIEYGEYQRPTPADEFELLPATSQKGSMGENNVLLGGLGGLSYKTSNSKYKFTAMHLQNGESKAAQLRIIAEDDIPGLSDYQAYTNNLEYSQRGLTNLLLSGQHYKEEGKWQINWKVSPTFSNITEPDIRKTAFTITAGDSSFEPGQGGNPLRIWRYLNEVNVVGKIDVIREHQLFADDAKFKFGASHVFKNRDYEIIQYDLVPEGLSPNLSGDPNQVLIDDNIFPTGEFYYQSSLQAGFPNPNEYQSNVQYSSLYISEEFAPMFRLKAIVGLRGELFLQRHTGRDQTGAIDPNAAGGNVLDNELVLDAFDLFPSVNLIYQLDENMNLRGSYFRSIARPSFKELSFAQILDPISNRTFNGGLFPYLPEWDGNLISTRINNYDLRWEYFMERGELLSVSFFYKQFDSPIELVRIRTAPNSNDFQPRNVGDGQLFGTELELRKSLDFITPSLRNFSFSSNLTFTYSEIDMTETEYLARLGAEKEGQTIDRTRAMAGQAPYIINGGISYDNPEINLSSGVYYNVKGRTLEIVGGQSIPDVYTEPFHSLNYTLNKTFGEENNMSLNFKVTNILGDARESFFSAFNAEDQIFTRLLPGTSFSLGFGYDF